MNDKPKDDNDLLQEGTLTADPTADCEPMETPPGAPESTGANEIEGAKVGTVAGIFDGAWGRLKARADGIERPVATPWKVLNDKLGGGFWPGELIPVVGNTGTGKTQWALQIALHNARAGRPVYYVALESDPMEMVARLMVLEYASQGKGRKAWSRLCHGKDDDLGVIAPATKGALCELPLTFTFGEPLSWEPGTLEETLKRCRNDGEHPLVVVDFLQLIGSKDPGGVDIRERISAGSYQLRHLAREYSATILVLSATARSNYDIFNGTKTSGGGKSNSTPKTSFTLGESPPEKLQGSGKESGEIEYAAATVIALCRKPETKEEPNPPVHVAVVKARAGRRGWVGPLLFDGTGYTEQPGSQPAKGESRVYR